MFSDCHSLKYINITNIDTTKIESMKYLFNSCHSLISINLHGFDTAKTTSFESMFSGCSFLVELDLSFLDISSLKNMENIFGNCTSLENINLSRIDTSNVENMGHMFTGCSNLSSINLENFNTSSVKKMDYMFAGCSSLEKVITSSFNTSSVVNMSHMFEDCISLISLNLSNFETNNVRSVESMFSGDYNLVYVNLQNIVDSGWSNMNNILSGTLENMVFCYDEIKAPSLNRVILNKGCTIINCDDNNPTRNRKYIVAKTSQCVDKCEKDYKFLYDCKCWERCPFGLVSNDFVCKENYTRNGPECKIKDFFRHYCDIELNTPLEKQKFIDETVKEILSSELYDLIVLALDNKEVLTVKHEKETYQLYMLSNKIRIPETSYIDLEECGRLLKRKYNIKEEEELFIFKIEYKSSDFRIPIIEYNIFDQEGTFELNINYCRNIKINYFIYKDFNFEDYLYNPKNKYYNDQCYLYTTKNGRDIILYDKKDEFNKYNLSICESICTFKGYENKFIECECSVKSKFNSFMNVNSDKYNLINRFEGIKLNSFNGWVVRCYYLIFSKANLLSNIGGLTIAAIIFINLVCIIVFRVYEYKILIRKMLLVFKATFNYKNLNLFNQHMTKCALKLNNKNNFNGKLIKFNEIKAPISDKSIIEPKSSLQLLRINKKNSIQGINNNKKKIKNLKKNNNDNTFQNFMQRTDNELNFLPFEEALKYDKRLFWQYYLSLIRTKQILVFTFNPRNDFNSRVIKICFLLSVFTCTLTLTSLFINDKFLHNLYISDGSLDFVGNIPMNMYTCLITYIITRILTLLIFTEKNVIEIKQNKQQKNKTNATIFIISIKFLLFFFMNIIINLGFLVYVSCFCVVFQNTQFHLLINTAISLGIHFIVPFIINLLPPIVRIYSLNKKKSLALYMLSKFLQIL